MPSIFEGFLTHALRAAFLTLDPRTIVRGQFHGFLDVDDRVPMRPDIVWLDAVNGPLAIIDAKYKAETVSGYPNADVYQALAYATALGLPDAHLVYARGNEPVSSYLIRGSGVRVHAHALDLALPPAGLLNQISGLAVTIAGRASLTSIEFRCE
jgi:5-methylcytosine-specific restriction enzyme subunit McrC